MSLLRRRGLSMEFRRRIYGESAFAGCELAEFSGSPPSGLGNILVFLACMLSLGQAFGSWEDGGALGILAELLQRTVRGTRLLRNPRTTRTGNATEVCTEAR